MLRGVQRALWAVWVIRVKAQFGSPGFGRVFLSSFRNSYLAICWGEKREGNKNNLLISAAFIFSFRFFFFSFRV